MPAQIENIKSFTDWLAEQKQGVMRYRRAEAKASELGISLEDARVADACREVGWRYIGGCSELLAKDDLDDTP